MSTLNPALTARHRTCSRCGRDKPWFAFYAATRWPDGSMRRPRPDCKECVRHLRATYYQTHRGVVLARKAQRWRTDAAYRLAHYQRKRHCGVATHAKMLDPAPFALFLKLTFGSRGEACRVTGLPEKQMRRYLNGSNRINETVVDRVLCHLDNGTRLQDLYPGLED